jgi:Tfp pilus assembly protein PilP
MFAQKHPIKTERSVQKIKLKQGIVFGGITLLVLMALVVFFPRQRGGMKELMMYLKKVGERQEVAISKLPELQVFNIPSYEGGRNPFVSEGKVTEDESALIKKTGIEAYPLNVLKLVGIVAYPDGYVGVVETPAGEVYPVRLGAVVGQDEGQVVSIDKNQVKIVEKVKVGSGHSMDRVTELKL